MNAITKLLNQSVSNEMGGYDAYNDYICMRNRERVEASVGFSDPIFIGQVKSSRCFVLVSDIKSH